MKFLVYEWLGFRDVVSEEAVDGWLDGLELNPSLDIEVVDPYDEEGCYGAVKSADSSEELFTEVNLEELYLAEGVEE